MPTYARAVFVGLFLGCLSTAVSACSDDDENPGGAAGSGNASGTAGKAGSGAAGAAGSAAGGTAGAAGSAAGGAAGAAGSAAGGKAGSAAGGSAGSAAGGSAGTASGGAAGTTAGGSAGAAAGGAAGSNGGGSAGATAGGAAGAAGSGTGGAAGASCPPVGATLAIAAGTATAAGPKSATKDAASGTCVGAGLVEQLVQLVPAVSGTLSLTIKPKQANFQPGVYLRSGACDGPEAFCSASSTLAAQAVQGAPLFLFVEAANPGDYDIETTLTPKDTGADACAAARPSVTLAANNTIGPTGDTQQGSANVTPPAACAAGASGKEIVFTFVPASAGNLELAILTESATFDGVLSVVQDCAAPSTTLACVNATGPGGIEETVLPVEANKTYYVIVDTLGGGGAFTLSANLATPE